jgi:CDP-glycerol glycerophosphotransferase (TagB/SpsB family)
VSSGSTLRGGPRLNQRKTTRVKLLLQASLSSLGELVVAVATRTIYLISGFVPRRKHIWVFGSWDGKKFADNPKYLFLYVYHNHPEITGVWLSRNKTILAGLRARGYKAYYMHSLRGILYSMRANCIIFSVGVSDVNLYTTNGTKSVQLWHGTPLKKIALIPIPDLQTPTSKSSCARRLIVEGLRPNKKHDIVIAASDENKQTMRTVFSDAREIAVTGYPRNDVLLGAPWLSKLDPECVRRIKREINYQFLFLYLPTFRREVSRELNLFARYGFDGTTVNQTLRELNAILIIKAHPYFRAHQYDEQTDPDSEGARLERIFTLSDEDLPDIYPLLRETSVLITDYSSAFFDYLLLDRPIVFAPFDIQQYTTTDHELFFDYDQVTPGPKAKDWPDVLRLLREAVQNDSWKAERREVCTRFNKFHDSNSSERVFQVICRLLEQTTPE